VGLIERSRSPNPLEDRDLDQLTLEEARELVCRSREEARIKQEEGVGREQSVMCDESASSERSVKRRRCTGNDGDIVFGKTKRAKAKPKAPSISSSIEYHEVGDVTIWAASCGVSRLGAEYMNDMVSHRFVLDARLRLRLVSV
jgi:hypothetical protein